MQYSNSETVIVSLGGSLIVPDDIDTDFLTSFRDYVVEHIERHGTRFVIIAGGGKTARRYQRAATALTDLSDADADWLGIHGTRINAHLLRTILADHAEPAIITNPLETPPDSNASVLVASGWKPGWSTDYVAVKIAERLGARRMASLSNIDYAYDKDPKQHDDAQPITDISWHEFRALMPDEWDPGSSVPFDPVASRQADALGMEVGLMNGATLDQLEAFLKHEAFTGTRIHTSSEEQAQT